MNLLKSPIVWLVALFISVIVATMTLFTVSETEKALRFRFGEIIETDYQPGLHFKWPLINNIRTFDARVQTLDTQPERFLTAEKKNVMVDSFVKWRISDVEKFYTTVGGSVLRANERLDQITKDGLRSEFSKRELTDVVSGDRQQIMQIISQMARQEATQLGIDVLDVRIKRIDLPAEVSNSVFRRMRAERERVARDFRSRGAEEAEKIRAEADRQRTVMLAEAYRDAERNRGEGDAKAAQIYAEAYQANTNFFKFYRSMNAYRESFKAPNGLLILNTDSDFFRYFNQHNSQ